MTAPAYRVLHDGTTLAEVQLKSTLGLFNVVLWDRVADMACGVSSGNMPAIEARKWYYVYGELRQRQVNTKWIVEIHVREKYLCLTAPSKKPAAPLPEVPL
jgi:hypothetical protein